MKTLTIAFDVDGTLIRNGEEHRDRQPVANERIRSLLIALSSFKNVNIVVWSGGGELYARQAGAAIGIHPYVDAYMDKNYAGVNDQGKHVFYPDLTPDIAIDDIQDCELGKLNLIVREK